MIFEKKNVNVLNNDKINVFAEIIHSRRKKLKIASSWLCAGVSNSITQGPVLANKV